MKLALLLLLPLQLSLVAADCLFNYYPSGVAVGNVEAQIGRDPEFHDTDLLYNHQLPQTLTLDDDAQPSKNCMISVNGLEVIRTQQYEETKFSVQVNDIKIINTWSEKVITGLVFKVMVGSTFSNNQKRYNWNYVKFKFIYSNNAQLYVGQVRSPRIMPSGIKHIYRVEANLPKNQLQSNFNIKQIIPKIFLTRLHIEQLPFDGDNYGFDIEGTIKKIENLRKYAWNQQIISKLTKVLTDQKIPSLYLSEVSAFESNQENFQLGFKLVTTSSINIFSFSFSFMLYLESSTERGQNTQNFYQYTEGNFMAKNNEMVFYQGIKHTEMFIIGFNGYRASYASIQQYDQFGFEFEMAAVEEFKHYLHVRAKNQNSEFFFDYLGIETIPSFYCMDCSGSPYLYEGQFCLSECPDDTVKAVNGKGYWQCKQCSIDDNFVPDIHNNACKCMRKFYHVAPTNKCEPCPKDCLTCNGNRCLSCDHRRGLNIHTSRCQCLKQNLNGFAYFTNNQQQCQRCHQSCKSCFGREPNQCIECHYNRLFTQQRYCKCEQNFVQDDKGQCQCLAPYSYNGSSCIIKDRKCRQNQFFVLDSSNRPNCQCIPEYFRHKVTNICVQKCKQGQIYGYLNSQCQCPEKLVYDSSTERCIECSQRPNQRYNEQTSQCECISGDFSLDPVTKRCIKCPVNQYFHFQQRQCKCIFNYYKRGEQCVRCQHNSQGPNCHITPSYRTQLTPQITKSSWMQQLAHNLLLSF